MRKKVLLLTLTLIGVFFLGSSIFLSGDKEVVAQRPRIQIHSPKSDPDAEKYGSVLVLNLDDKPVEVIASEKKSQDSERKKKTSFDLDEDGFKEEVSWINPKDAILVLDINKNGQIDNSSELFGYANLDKTRVSGFKHLTEYDSNKDGIINDADEVFSRLKLWQDFDFNGESQDSEIKSLKSFGVKSIDVSNLSEINQEVKGGKILQSANYTFGQNIVAKVFDVSLAINQMNAFHYEYMDRNGKNISYQADMDALLLPQSRGYGKLPAFYVALAIDSGMKTRMFQIINLPVNRFFDGDVDNLSLRVEEFCYRWAGVQNIVGYRGEFDAKKLATVEAFLGRGFVDNWGNTEVSETQLEPMTKVWNKFVGMVKERILVQGLFYDEFKQAHYDRKSDAMNYSELNVEDMFLTIAKKYNEQKNPNDASNYLRGIVSVLELAVKDIKEVGNMDKVKSELLSRIGIYTNPSSKEVYYLDIPSDFHLLPGYEYYDKNDNRVTQCLKKQNFIKKFVLEHFPKKCSIF